MYRSGGALGPTTSVVAVHRSAGGDKFRPPPLLGNDIRTTAQPPEQISAAALLANHIGPQNRYEDLFLVLLDNHFIHIRE